MPSNSSIAAVRKDTQRLELDHRMSSEDSSYISGCRLTLPSLRSEKTHNDCELDHRMSFEDSFGKKTDND